MYYQFELNGKHYQIPTDDLEKYEVKREGKYSTLVIPMEFTHFGYDWLDVTNSLKGSIAYHPGIDYNYGSPWKDLGKIISSMADGKVTFIKKSSGFGWHIFIKHTDLIHKKYGKINCWTHYCHLRYSPSVRVGDNVKAGDPIGECGNTGFSTAPHLHFEIRKRPLGTGFYPYGKTKRWVEENYYNPKEFI